MLNDRKNLLENSISEVDKYLKRMTKRTPYTNIVFNLKIKIRIKSLEPEKKYFKSVYIKLYIYKA